MKRVIALSAMLFFFCQHCLAQDSGKDIYTAYSDTLKFVSRKGPRNADSANFATLYLIRPANTVGGEYWFSIKTGNNILLKADNNTRFKIRIHKEGPIEIGASGDSKIRSIVKLDVAFHQNYFLLMELIPATLMGNPIFKVLDATAGEQLYNSHQGMEYIVNYPLILNQNSRFSALRPRFIADPNRSLRLGPMVFLPPVSTEYFFEDLETFIFPFSDFLLSQTFTETITMTQKEIDPLPSEESLLVYIKKQIRDGKTLTTGKEKLISLNYEPFKRDNCGGWLVQYEVEDRDAPNRGNAKFLLMRNVDAYIYTKTGQQKDILTHVAFSERGLPEEIHLKEEIRFKVFYFLRNVKFF